MQRNSDLSKADGLGFDESHEEVRKSCDVLRGYIGRWLVRLDGYHMIIEHRMRDKHQNADSLSKKTEFCEKLEQKQANQAENKEGFSFLDKKAYEALPLTR